MRNTLTIGLLLAFALPQTAPAQKQRSTRSLEGVVVAHEDGAKWHGIVVESKGVKYTFPTYSAIDREPKIIGGDVEPIGTRVRVTYRNWGRPDIYGNYLAEALVIVRLSKRAQDADKPVSSRGSVTPMGSSDMPPIPYEDIGACPFEGCQYGVWIANKPTLIQRGRQANSAVAFRVVKAEKVTAITGVVITTEPGQARVLKPIAVGGNRANTGESLFLLTDLGEGAYKVWYKGRIETISLSDMGHSSNEESQYFKRPRHIWWIKIRNSKGQVGWTRQPSNFSGRGEQ